jgi:polyhydroxybutyrate depolymerase
MTARTLPLRAALLAATLALTLALSAVVAAEPVERHVRVGAAERSYLVDLPPGYDGRRALPVVLVFHGGGGAAASARTQTRMSEKGRAEGFIAVYPQGSGLFSSRLLTWNATTCCGYAMQHRVDETAFVAALLDDLEASFAVDRARVYATGISNGGMMAYLAACTLADRVAAIAVVAGELTLADCRPARPVPVLVIHGSADRYLPYEGGVGEKALAKHAAQSVRFAVDFWRANDRCADAAASERAGSVIRERYAPCAAGSAVELVTIEGAGHSWPGGAQMARFLDEPSTALDATSEIWAFFARH